MAPPSIMTVEEKQDHAIAWFAETRLVDVDSCLDSFHESWSFETFQKVVHVVSEGDFEFCAPPEIATFTDLN